MPGTADRNLKRALFQEELGLLCLSGLCAVAPVPRPHDVGIDVICTLLHPDGGRRMLAGKSFYVQLKAESVSTILYEPAATAWLKKLSMPLFFGRVSIRHGLELYTSHLVARAMIEREWETFSISFGSTTAAEACPSGRRQVVLGPPILRWSPSDLASIDDERNLNDILSTWVDVEYENIGLRRLRMFKTVGTLPLGSGGWETNQPPVIRPQSTMAVNSALAGQDTSSFAAQASLPTVALGMDCLLKKSPLVPAVVQFCDALVELGADAAAFEVFKTLAQNGWPDATDA